MGAGKLVTSSEVPVSRWPSFGRARSRKISAVESSVIFPCRIHIPPSAEIVRVQN